MIKAPLKNLYGVCFVRFPGTRSRTAYTNSLSKIHVAHAPCPEPGASATDVS